MIKNKIAVDIIPFEQPAGTFYSAIMAATDLIDISILSYLSYDPDEQIISGEPQRKPSTARKKDICKYSKTPDACFPTSIIIAIDSEYCEFNDDFTHVKIMREKCAVVVDGQHRIFGLELDLENAKKFTLPVVFMFDATDEQKALIFSTINGKQTKVPKSIVYLMFNVSKTRSAYKVANDIVSSLNSMPDSPWFRRLKMLGKKTRGGIETLSQGTFIKELLPHITKNADDDLAAVKSGEPAPVCDDCIFNGLYVNGKDDIILKILVNYFSGIKAAWPEQWKDIDNSILVKSVGFSGVMLALKPIVKNLLQGKDLSISKMQSLFLKIDFNSIFKDVEEVLTASNNDLSKDRYSTSAANAKKLCNDILRAMDIAVESS